MPPAEAPALFDLAIIGGGINGCGIAREAAGRGWSVFLCETNDLAAATSSASTKLIHGGLRYLEHRAFRLVREALRERAVLWGIAPHIIWPLRFVLPHQKGLRAAWKLRLGLALYDHLGGRRRLPGARAVKLQRDAVGQALHPDYKLGFEYSDCWVEDARLVVLNAMDAASRGAVIAPRTTCLAAERNADGWTLRLQHRRTGVRQVIRARALVNAAGPWVGDVLHKVIRANTAARLRMVKGSHIVVRKLYPGDHCYVFQNADGRIVFAIPYEQDFTLIGTTDLDYVGDPADVCASGEEIAYLCRSASDYLRTRVTPAQIVWTYAGVRPLFDDGAPAAQAATRDYRLDLDSAGGAALLSVFGGKITTYRRLGQAVLDRLAPHLPPAAGLQSGWTGSAPLPGGDFPVDGFDALLASLQARYPFMESATLRRLVRAYGTRVTEILGAADAPAALGTMFGAGLSELEVRYLVRSEWAVTASDILWRRSKLGLRMTPQQMAHLDAFMTALQPEQEHVV
jgi:glycerol-3-phosphate dehydrogenase